MGPTDRFSPDEVQRILGLTGKQLDYWDRLRLVSPRRDKGIRSYDFRDLIGLRTVKQLSEKGVPANRLQRALAALREKLSQVQAPLAREGPSSFSSLAAPGSAGQDQLPLKSKHFDSVIGHSPLVLVVVLALVLAVPTSPATARPRLWRRGRPDSQREAFLRRSPVRRPFEGPFLYQRRAFRVRRAPRNRASAAALSLPTRP